MRSFIGFVLIFINLCSSKPILNLAKTAVISIIDGDKVPHEIRHGNTSITTAVEASVEKQIDNERRNDSQSKIRTVLSRVVHSSMDDMLKKLITSLQEILNKSDQKKNPTDISEKRSNQKDNKSSEFNNKQFLEMVIKGLMNSKTTKAPNRITSTISSLPTLVTATWATPINLTNANANVININGTSTTNWPSVNSTVKLQTLIPVRIDQTNNFQMEKKEEFNRPFKKYEFQLDIIPSEKREEIPMKEKNVTSEELKDSRFVEKNTKPTTDLVLSRILKVNESRKKDFDQVANSTHPFNTESKKPQFGSPDSADIIVTGVAEKQDNIEIKKSRPSHSASRRGLINPTLLCTLLISSAAGLSILMFASFGLLYACYGIKKRPTTQLEPTDNSSASSNHDNNILPQPFDGKRFLPRLTVPKPFYYQQQECSRSQMSLIPSGSFVADRQLETCTTIPSMLERQNSLNDSTMMDTEHSIHMDSAAVLY